MTKGYVTNRPGLGINGEEISEYSAYMQGLESGGVYVTYISEDMPVAKSGLKVGDIISKVNGTAVTSVTDIQTVYARDFLLSTVERGGDRARFFLPIYSKRAFLRQKRTYSRKIHPYLDYTYRFLC